MTLSVTEIIQCSIFLTNRVYESFLIWSLCLATLGMSYGLMSFFKEFFVMPSRWVIEVIFFPLPGNDTGAIFGVRAETLMCRPHLPWTSSISSPWTSSISSPWTSLISSQWTSSTSSPLSTSSRSRTSTVQFSQLSLLKNKIRQYATKKSPWSLSPLSPLSPSWPLSPPSRELPHFANNFFERNSQPARRGERINRSTGLRWQMHVFVYITNTIDVLGQIQEAW